MHCTTTKGSRLRHRLREMQRYYLLEHDTTVRACSPETQNPAAELYQTFIRSDYHNERTEMEKNCRRTRKTKTLEGQLYFTGVYCDCTLPTDGSPYKSDSWVVAQGTIVDFLEMNRRSDSQIKADDMTMMEKGDRG